MARPESPWLRHHWAQLAQVLLYGVLILYGIITLVPFLWAVSASFKPLADIVQGGMNFIPQTWTLANYQAVFEREPLFWRWFGNSLLIASVVTVANVLFNSMAGYALARLTFPGQRAMFWLVLAVLVVPGQITLIPSYLILSWLGWLNTYQGMIVPAMVNATFIFMMRQFFVNFPQDLEEAAALDGLNRLETFFWIVLPLARPALAAQAIFVFMGSWNDFLKPLVILSDPAMFTLPLGLNTFKGQYITYWNLIMAAAVLMTLPILIIYVWFNRYFIQGVTFTGSK